VVAAICIAAAAAAEEEGRVGGGGLARGGGRKREGARGWGEVNIYGVRNGSAPSDLGVRYGLGRLIARVGG
jgi:hypothetical protein